MHYYFTHNWKKTKWVHAFPKGISAKGTQETWVRIWIQPVVSIFCIENNNATGCSMNKYLDPLTYAIFLINLSHPLPPSLDNSMELHDNQKWNGKVTVQNASRQISDIFYERFSHPVCFKVSIFFSFRFNILIILRRLSLATNREG